MSLIKVKSRGTDNVSGRKNLIINGAMRVAQRGTQATSISSNGYFSTDRMKFYESGSGVFTVEQVSDAPSGSGFQYSHKVTATTADTSIGSADLICPLWYIVEKRDVDARLAYGTSSAKPITMSFWIKSNVTGTYTISAYRSATPARVQAQTYTISSANTWEFKTLTFLGDTAEAIDVDLHFYFNGLVGGSYDNTGTTSGWATYDTGNWAGGHTATCFDTANDTWQMTGLQLEVGDEASDFEHRSFGEELQLCRRYFENSNQAGTPRIAYLNHVVYTTSASYCTYFYDVEKRVAPSISHGSAVWRIYQNGVLIANANGQGGSDGIGTRNFALTLSGPTFSNNSGGMADYRADNGILIDAEL